MGDLLVKLCMVEFAQECPWMSSKVTVPRSNSGYISVETISRGGLPLNLACVTHFQAM